ncbi:3-oxoacyl-[acyl-carrier-protein] synthase 3 [Lacunisphaera limnophila]|uniref:Beta-ketoacyl-[acyl-carrier-protein] synthase III n=1 Tax=Lacunisphaera limnophila TaxID=1838286 RepID=A0A1D8AWZ5_9BACT|nr:beta-ketoacyl-ACP synthase III [Lacunisphaera limnophila]AOS45409.1 3-oxoacyl-[acyl-carrier-protein] synthase 3 [Lacunisphaera limnophila]
MTSVIIAGVGSYSPAKVLTNEELSQKVDTTDEWIRTRSGIRERRIAAADEACSDLAVKAAAAALADAKVTAADIDLLIVATCTPDLPLPSTACIVQHKLGVPAHATCFDIAAACSGFLYALEIAYGQLQTNRYKRALIIGSEKLSTITDWTDRTTCVLFGDGAGAAVLNKVNQPGIGILGTDLGADGAFVDNLYIPAGGSRTPATPETIANHGHCIHMNGREVFKSAVRVMETVAREMMEQHHLTPDQISLVIPHQANIRIIEALAGNLKMPLEKFFVNLDRYGNTSSATIPLALDEARRAGRIKPGDLTLLVAFGAGLTYGATLVRW